MNTHIPSTIRFRRQGGAVSVLLTIVVAVIVGLGVGGAIYYWHHHKVDDLQKQVQSLNERLSKGQGSPQPSTSSNSSSSTPSPTPSATPGTTYSSQKGVKITIYTPAKNASVASPVGVVGKVPGSWSNEASFPVQIKDGAGKVIAQGTAQVLGDWMTDQLVPFSAKLTYASATPGPGTLVLQKDNPSGLASNDDSVSIPLRL